MGLHHTSRKMAFYLRHDQEHRLNLVRLDLERFGHGRADNSVIVRAVLERLERDRTSPDAERVLTDLAGLVELELERQREHDRRR